MHHNKLIIACSDSDLFGVFKCFFPRGVRIAVLPYITVIMEMLVRHVIAELAVADGSRLLAKVYAGLIESHRIKRGKHSDIGNDRRVILSMAVAVR